MKKQEEEDEKGEQSEGETSAFLMHENEKLWVFWIIIEGKKKVKFDLWILRWWEFGQISPPIFLDA